MPSSLDTPIPLHSLLGTLNQRLELLHTEPTIASPAAIQHAISELPSHLPNSGFGTDQTIDYVERVILPALASGHSGPRYVITSYPNEKEPH